MKPNWEVPFRYLVVTALLVLLLGALWYIREIFRPLISAALIAYFLSPAVSFAKKRFRLPHKTAAGLVYLISLLLLILLLGTAVPVLFDEVQTLLSDLQSAFFDLEVLLGAPLRFGNLSVDFRLLVLALKNVFRPGAIAPQPSEALRFLQLTSRGVLWALVILVTAYYFLAEWQRLRDWLIHLAPPSQQEELHQLYLRVREVWMSYLLGQIRLMFILAVMYSLAWQVIGLPGAFVLGAMAGLFNLLPEVGPASIAFLAVLVAFLEGSRWPLLASLPHIWFAVLTLGLYLLLNTFKTVWLQPRILGQSVSLHEGLVFVAIITALILQGFLGVLIVVPLLATLMVVGRYMRRKLLGLPPFEEEAPASISDLEAGAPPKAESTPVPPLPRRKAAK